MAPEFLQKKLTEVSMNVDPLHHDVFFYPLLVSFHLQIAYKKVRNLQNRVDRLVGKVLIHSLHHTKFARACIISIIIDAPAVAYAHS